MEFSIFSLNDSDTQTGDIRIRLQLHIVALHHISYIVFIYVSEGSFSDIIQHAIQDHSKEELKLRRKIFNESTGKISLQTIDFSVIPDDIASNNKYIEIDPNLSKIRIKCQTSFSGKPEMCDTQSQTEDDVFPYSWRP